MEAESAKLKKRTRFARVRVRMLSIPYRVVHVAMLLNERNMFFAHDMEVVAIRLLLVDVRNFFVGVYVLSAPCIRHLVRGCQVFEPPL